ncbi:SURF1 family protein [Rhodalgimonas zhirmunskyi]|uniref:SURF1-like protein n=1 Tax=Rhodalgimonas zhirmunskyi TaxID=2964767 RepID=A0AAJ1UCP8_9RHOB|nr:SURF1 family protein [Rhodoalgimonas zhirmunskyi]MDQ2093752.1 SURF1 family protein [Rhodoalgimonas zhirmunskyi]
MSNAPDASVKSFLRANLPFLILSAGVLAVLLSLGNWQVRRLAEKEAYLAQIEAMIGSAPVAIPDAPDPESDRFRAVEARGRLSGPEVHVLVSTRDFGAGYRVIQGFETGGHKILLDRGFIRLTDKDRLREPGEIDVTGNLYWPDEIDDFTPENDLKANIWYARDVGPLAAHLGTEPVMLIARETVPNDPSIAPLPVDTASIPNRHMEYLLTWYGLAATWVLMTLYFLMRRRAKDAT